MLCDSRYYRQMTIGRLVLKKGTIVTSDSVNGPQKELRTDIGAAEGESH